MKGKRYAAVKAIQKACTDSLKDISLDDVKHSFDMPLDHANRCIKSRGECFE